MGGGEAGRERRERRGPRKGWNGRASVKKSGGMMYGRELSGGREMFPTLRCCCLFFPLHPFSSPPSGVASSSSPSSPPLPNSPHLQVLPLPSSFLPLLSLFFPPSPNPSMFPPTPFPPHHSFSPPPP